MAAARLKLTPPEGLDPRLIKLEWYYPLDTEGKPRTISGGAAVSEVRDPVRNIMRSVCEGHLPWPLVMSGPVGCGKTMASRVLTHHVLKVRSWKLYEWHRLTYADGVGPVWPMFRDATLVVLDELGESQNPTDGEKATLKQCLDIREHKPLVCITNRTLTELEKLYGDPVASRLACGTKITADHFGSDDRRLNL